MNWDDLRYFLAVTRHGSLSAAARALAVNHTTVLRRVAALETSVGARLFDRQPAGYATTAAGDELTKVALRVEEDIAAASRQLSGQDARISGMVRVTTVDIMALHVLPRHLARFAAAYPGIRLDLAVAEAQLNLTHREADVAIRLTQDPPENLVGRAVSGLAFAVYGAVRYLEAHAPVDDVAQYDWAGVDEAFDHTRLGQWYRKTVPAERIRFKANTVATLMEAAKAGVGVALLPCGLADTDPALRRLGPRVADVESKVWLLTHEDLRHMGRVRAFLDFMAAAFADERDLLEGERVAGGYS